MSATIDTVRAFLNEQEWVHELTDTQSAVRMRFRGANEGWTVLVQEVGEEGGKLVCYSLPSDRVPEGRRLAAAETITRLNSGLILGNFEMEYETGIVRYKTSADFRGHEVTTGLVGHLVFTNVIMVDRYLSALWAVVFKGRDPADAVAEVSE
ncbi:MAG: YbjN domain-containing protein [Myxococcota bacterium]